MDKVTVLGAVTDDGDSFYCWTDTVVCDLLPLGSYDPWVSACETTTHRMWARK